MKPPNNTLIDHLATTHRSKRELERRIAEIGLGVLASLQSREMTFDQARLELLNLDNYVSIRRRRLDRRLIEFFQWGMQLEDVAELAPEGLPESYEAMTKLAHELIRVSWASAAHTGKASVKLRKSA